MSAVTQVSFFFLAFILILLRFRNDMTSGDLNRLNRVHLSIYNMTMTTPVVKTLNAKDSIKLSPERGWISFVDSIISIGFV